MSGAAAPLHVESSGRGPALVFWHGWGMNLRVFDALRGALGDEYRCQAVDLPGHGRSTWQAGLDETLLPRLLAALPAQATLVGWSLGGQLALRAALQAPQRIRNLVLIATTPRFVRAADWTHAIDAPVLAQMRERVVQDYRGTVSDFLELQLRGSCDAARQLQALRAALLGHGEAAPEALAAGLACLAGTDLRSQLPRVTMRTLVIAGQNDRITPPGASAALAAALPEAQYHDYARAAHAPFLSHLEPIVQRLRTFLGAAPAP